ELRQVDVADRHGAKPRAAGAFVHEEEVAGAADAEQRAPRQIDQVAVLLADAGATELAAFGRRPVLTTGRVLREPGGHLRRHVRRFFQDLEERRHQLARLSSVGEWRVSIVLPFPRYMCTPHGRQGSKLRTARMMSMPLKLSRPFSSKIGVPWIASSYGPGVP